jgi:hypothetical protein
MEFEVCLWKANITLKISDEKKVHMRSEIWGDVTL